VRTFFAKLFSSPPPPTRPRSTLASQSDQSGLHIEITAIAVGDVLRKYGVPSTWITANPQPTVVPRRGRGIHLYLTVREWHPHLLAFMVTIERHVRARTLRLDPLSAGWLVGISWKFNLVDSSRCPAMPEASFWQKYVSRTGQAVGDRTVSAPVRDEPALSARLEHTYGTRDREFLPTQPMIHRART
jgi:hypothetical protein